MADESYVSRLPKTNEHEFVASVLLCSMDQHISGMEDVDPAGSFFNAVRGVAKVVKQTIRFGDYEIVYEADTPEELAAIMKSDDQKPEPQRERPTYNFTHVHHVHPIIQTSHIPKLPDFAPNIQC